jgi:N-acetylglutamate synthase-like GNAT family acetyltransferase
MKVRKATRKDVNQILKLLHSAKEVKAHDKYAVNKNYIISHLDNPMHLMLVCEEKREIMGVLTSEVWKDKKYAFISNIVVHKDRRAKGIGSILYDYFEKTAKAKKLKLINYFVQTTNKPMHKWSKKKGFRKGYQFYYYEKEI